jgi:hypothetical protein
MPSNVATAADYADAMMIARRAKNWLFLLLLIFLLAQIAIFFVARKTNLVFPAAPTPQPSLSQTDLTVATRPVTIATTQKATSVSVERATLINQTFMYVTALIDFLGVVLVILLAVTLLLIVNIMLVGRLIGLAQVTSAWIWCVLLAALLFPWQSFLQDPNFKADFKLPGVLYTWTELAHPTHGARFGLTDAGANVELPEKILKWARFVGFPVLSVVMLLMIQAKSSRGLRASLGETELDVTPGGDVRIA